MTTSEGIKSYSDRMQSFVTDAELFELDKKYDPYLELHQIDDVLDTFDIIQNAPNEMISGKLIWDTRFDLPTEFKRDIITLYNRHFVDQK
jgi:hypothetical protein